MDAIEKDTIVFTDFKLDYMARFFRKISHKKFESYVIQRIWHRLNDDRVRFVFQQEVVLAEGRALLDLYLPQIKVVVEVNKPIMKIKHRWSATLCVMRRYCNVRVPP